MAVNKGPNVKKLIEKFEPNNVKHQQEESPMDTFEHHQKREICMEHHQPEERDLKESPMDAKLEHHEKRDQEKICIEHRQPEERDQESPMDTKLEHHQRDQEEICIMIEHHQPEERDQEESPIDTKLEHHQEQDLEEICIEHCQPEERNQEESPMDTYEEHHQEEIPMNTCKNETKDTAVPLESDEVSQQVTKDDDKEEQDTVYFKDGIRKIDFVLTYKDDDQLNDEKRTEKEVKKSANRAQKRKKFIEALQNEGFEFEYQEPEFYDGVLWFVKVHATFPALEKGAEDLLFRMPHREADVLRRHKSFYRDIFTMRNKRDPFELFDPKIIPQKFDWPDFYTAPYIRNFRTDFYNSDDEMNFFSSAQRSVIVSRIMEKTCYGPKENQVGLSRLVQKGIFTSAFILHDGSFTKKADEDIQNERQLLHYEWSHPKNWYKYQPLENIRHYFGEKIGLYFAWLGFYTSWLGVASILGIIVMIAGLFTLSTDLNPPAAEICNSELREFFYMCPPCDHTCDFWYYHSACSYAHVSLLFDSGGTVFFAAFMACWAVLFLEFWKRREAHIQCEWETREFEKGEERERPEFMHAIKKKIRKVVDVQLKKHYLIYNPVIERYEYFQPPYHYWPKVALGFSVLATMVTAVLGVVFAVLIYRLAVSTVIYRLLESIPGGPSAADIIASITGSCIQLGAIVIMNYVYEKLATILTSWELNRTTTEHENSFTFKMYLFQFINYYASLFYIAFFKGKFLGYPGGYQRMGPYRLAECSTYGCLLELTIQLGIIFLGKQILNEVSELGIPYAKKIINKLLHNYHKGKNIETKEKHSFTRWEKDYQLVPHSVHGLFFEYLEKIIQYGFVTLFVCAFPLAPFFAWVSNIIEIRIDAHKFVQVFRRPLAEKAQDIGAWFHLLRFVTNLCIVTNAFLIAVTSQFIDREIFIRVYKDDPVYMDGKGFVTWSTSEFFLVDMINSTAINATTTFPAYHAQELLKYDANGTVLQTEDGENQLYLPFIDVDCLMNTGNPLFMTNTNGYNRTRYEILYRDTTFQNLVLRNENPQRSTSAILNDIGECFNRQATCRFRGQVNQDGTHPLRYWQLWAAKVTFIVVFEHFIFVIGILLDWLVPDIPKSVQDEITREKLLLRRMILRAGRT